jgi:hypothetical protein
MAIQTPTLYLVEDLDDPAVTDGLPDGDLRALRSISDWIESYVVQPHADLGRPGPVCPYVPVAIDMGALWLAAEHIRGRSPEDVVDLMADYRRQLLAARPADATDDDPAVIAVVFSDLSPEEAPSVFNAVLERLSLPSYEADGVLFGTYYAGNPAPATHNPHFRPFESPVPFVFVRSGTVRDWEFFLGRDDFMALWAKRYGEPGTKHLVEVLRALPWREQGHRSQEELQ